MALSICLSFHFKLGLSPHLMGGEDSHLPQVSAFGAATVCDIGALLFPLTMQRSLAPLNCTEVPCQLQMYEQSPELVASVQMIISVP